MSMRYRLLFFFEKLVFVFFLFVKVGYEQRELMLLERKKKLSYDDDVDCFAKDICW